MGGRRGVAGAVTAGAVVVAACVSDRNVEVAQRGDASHEAGSSAGGTGGARSHKEAGVTSGGAPGRARDGSVDAASGGAADANTSHDGAADRTDSTSRPVRDASDNGADAADGQSTPGSGGNPGTGGAGNGGSASGGTPNTGGKGGTAGNSAGGKAGAAGAGGTSTGGKGGAAGSGGASNTGGNGGAGGGGAAGPPCLTAASQAVLMGDSYITGVASPALQPALVKLDPYAANFRNYAVAGAALGSGGISLIPPQFATAVSANPDIRLVILVGGEGDIILCTDASCASLCTSAGSSTNAVCQSIVQKAVDALTTLTATMANAGVHDLIYYLYPHIPMTGPGGAGSYTEILDYAQSRLKPVCDGTLSRTGGKLTCHFVDLVQPFIAAGGDENPANFSPDGLHPTDVGQDIVAAQVYKAMKASCIGFTAADAAKNACTCN